MGKNGARYRYLDIYIFNSKVVWEPLYLTIKGVKDKDP